MHYCFPIVRRACFIWFLPFITFWRGITLVPICVETDYYVIYLFTVVPKQFYNLCVFDMIRYSFGLLLVHMVMIFVLYVTIKSMYYYDM